MSTTKNAIKKDAPPAKRVVYKTSSRYGRLTATQVKRAVAKVAGKKS